MVYLHFEYILLLELALFSQMSILPFLTLKVRIHPSEQLVNRVSKFYDFNNFTLVV